MTLDVLYNKDAYKISHIDQYPKGTELIFSNFTPRASRMEGVNGSVFFGLQYFIKKYLNKFSNDKKHYYAEALAQDYTNFVKMILGVDKFQSHIKDLLLMPYLPLAIYALPEKTFVPNKVPALVMFNTDPRFYWLPNMLETIISCTLWGMCNSATIAREYRLILDKYAAETSDIPEFVDYQAHDFSYRGMFSHEAACISGMAHLQYFKGSDCIPALLCNNEYYGITPHIASVPATEHSVMSAGGKDNEFETFERLITEIYPDGIISIVSDTWDLWHVVSEFLPRLKSTIINRNGKVVIRPDSGDPANILCGGQYIQDPTLAESGLIEALWDIFGGTVNAKGYKQLDPHIGAIYGDSITLDRCRDICERLKQKGFASTNIVFGVGSYTYQYNTRDTLGWAMKATYAEINGEGHAITKNPKTDDGTKKSHSGILKVIRDTDGRLICKENCTWEEFYADDNELKLVYKNGVNYG